MPLDYATEMDFPVVHSLGCVRDQVAAVETDVWPELEGLVGGGAAMPAQQEDPQSKAMCRVVDLSRGKFDAQILKQHRCGWWGGEEDDPDVGSRAVEVMERDLAISASVRKVGKRSNGLRKGRKGMRRQRQKAKRQKAFAAAPAPAPASALAAVVKKVNSHSKRPRGACVQPRASWRLIGSLYRSKYLGSLPAGVDLAKHAGSARTSIMRRTIFWLHGVSAAGSLLGRAMPR